MERQIPDVWNIFSLSGPNYGLKSHQGDDSRRPQIEAGIHVNWSPRNQDLLLKWCDRSSACDRPRTYDKFYQKMPGNFYDSRTGQTDSAISVCSSEEETDGHERTRPKDKQRKKKRTRDISRTITERDVKHLERHLSMKKTIRKKIMRDLQQAFVDDPSKFQNDPVDNPINLNSLNFDPKTHNPSDQKFLDLLRDSEDSGHGSQPSANEGTPILAHAGSGSSSGSHGRQQKFRSVRERSKSTPRIPVVSDSSSCGGYESAESDRYHDDCRSSRKAGHSVEHLIEVVTLDDEKDQPKQVEVSDQPKNSESKKKSFWKMLTGNSKKSKENATK